MIILIFKSSFIHALECLISTFQDKNIWISVIDMLKKKDKLPAVAFTFSKKKIDENAQNLLSKDLTTASEKSEIHIFFHSAIKKLKPPDQKLPQVILIPSYLMFYSDLILFYVFLYLFRFCFKNHCRIKNTHAHKCIWSTQNND